MAGVNTVEKMVKNPITNTSSIWKNGQEKEQDKMQEILWNDKKALLIDFKDLDRYGEKKFRQYLIDHNYLEALVFKVSDLMFIPKDLRKMLTYSKMVHVAILPKNHKVIPPELKTCPGCGGTGKTRFIFRSENEPIRPYDYEICTLCSGTGKIKMVNEND